MKLNTVRAEVSKHERDRNLVFAPFDKLRAGFRYLRANGFERT